MPQKLVVGVKLWMATILAAGLMVLGAAPASAASEGQGYLALGDSIPFGFNPNPELWSNASNFIGYPEIVAGRLDIRAVAESCSANDAIGCLDRRQAGE